MIKARMRPYENMGRYRRYSTIISQMGIRLDVGANMIKNQYIAKEKSRFFFIRNVAKMKRDRIIEMDKKVGNSNKDFDTRKS